MLGNKKNAVFLTYNDGIGQVPEAVEALKNTIASLYTVFNMKMISHLQLNACKFRPS